MTMIYQNPVYPEDFADPFVLQTGGQYYAYGTARPGEDGRVFPVLRSTDLIHWQRLAGALQPSPQLAHSAHWAPEVAEKDGRFYLYYSAADGASDEFHRLRVATAQDPAGPFIDSGNLLLPDAGFSIDASPFHDPQTGHFYLFFATDYVHEEPYGTGLAVVRLSDDLLSTVGAPSVIARANADWQIYEQNRNYKGRLWPKWFCLEGPNALFHDGKYYCFYSGGAWHGNDYGVGFLMADNPLGPWRNPTDSRDPTVLRSVPGKVIGPGHTSTVRSPHSQTRYMVYHAWDSAKTARRMCIDPIQWTPAGPKVDGPSTEPRRIE